MWLCVGTTVGVEGEGGGARGGVDIKFRGKAQKEGPLHVGSRLGVEWLLLLLLLL